jgi:LysR family hydrogen peroxide-inducible transcriptional activator
LKLFLREETSQAACDALHRGQLDCVLLAAPFPCGDVEMFDLFEDELLLAFPPHEDPPLSIAADAIDEQRLLLLEDGHCLKDHALAACNRPQLRAEARMLGTSLHTLVQMVDNGLGLTLVPQMAVAAGILDGTGIVTRRLDASVTSRRIALAWRKGSPRSAEFHMLGEALMEARAD